MRNHDEKHKDMVRSVLPSTSRKSAKDDRRAIHKSQRSRQRNLLAEIRQDFDFTEPDFHEGRRKSALHWMVLDRRGADKIGPLTRWAAAVVEADPALSNAPLHVRVRYFRQILPPDLIGAHAVQHIEWALRALASRDQWKARDDARRKRPSRRRAEVEADVRRLLVDGRHADLNAALRHHYRLLDEEVQVPRRFLLGSHDVEPFAAEVANDPVLRALIAACAGN